MQIGTLLADKYRIERLLGQGAVGAVYLATQLDLGRHVAIKVLRAAYAQDPDARARFVREAKVAAQLRHPNTVSVIDFGEVDGQLYIVMDYLVGQDLRSKMELGSLELPNALQIARDVAAGLAAAHDIGCVHRDIKPENIFLVTHAEGERARVVDFGLAFIAAPEDGALRALGRLTEDGTLGGTTAYMSPEQIRGASVGPGADVYALGCVLYEMLCGHTPFIGHIGELLTRHAYAAPISLRHREPPVAVPPDVDALVLSMLAKSPALRPPAREVVRELDSQLTTAQGGPRGAAARATRDERAIIPDEVYSGPAPQAELKLGVLGDITDDFTMELAASGIVVVRNPANVDAVAAIWATPEVPASAWASYATRVPVVASAPIHDVRELLPWIAAGAADLVVTPLRADDVARKVRRVAKQGRVG